MCLGVPAQIVKIPEPGRADVSISGVIRTVSTDLITEPIKVDDWLLIHVGFALSTIDPEEAAITLQQIKQLGGDTFEDELDSFSTSDIGAGGGDSGAGANSGAGASEPTGANGSGAATPATDTHPATPAVSE